MWISVASTKPRYTQTSPSFSIQQLYSVTNEATFAITVIVCFSFIFG